MAKSKLPSVDDVGIESEPVAAEATTREPEQKPQSPGYISRSMVKPWIRSDASLTTKQAILLRSKTWELQKEGATLADGSPISTKSDTIRWLIENSEIATSR